MKDSKGNEFGVGDKLKSSKSPSNIKGDIECIATNGNVASMERIHGIPISSRPFYLFDIDQEELLTSNWVKVEQ